MLNVAPPVLISRVIVLIVAFTIHELAHALTADYFGDDTPRSQGRISLNPAVHLDPLGSILLLFFGFGWAKPVIVDAYYLQRRSPAALMLVSFAGPLSNLFLAILAAIPVKAGLITFSITSGNFFPTPYQFISEFVFINLLLMLFNLIPVPPLDGDKILYFFLPAQGKDIMDKIRPYGPMILMALIFAAPAIGLNIIGGLISPSINFLFGLLLG